MERPKGTIGILTGGGDVPGLNPAIRAITVRALREGYRVLGIRRGWAGLVELVPDPDANNSAHVQVLSEDIVVRAGRTGGTLLHTSRTRPSHLPQPVIPPHLADRYQQEINDATPALLKNLDFLGIDFLIPIGGDDTLSYAHRLHEEGVNIVAIPKTMDNDVPGTDYCIGFSTCVTRTRNSPVSPVQPSSSANVRAKATLKASRSSIKRFTLGSRTQSPTRWCWSRRGLACKRRRCRSRATSGTSTVTGVWAGWVTGWRSVSRSCRPTTTSAGG